MLAAILCVLSISAAARSESEEDAGCDEALGACVPTASSSEASRSDPARTAEELLFFWGVGCPHCEQAKPFVETLREELPELRITSIEVRQDARGRERFLEIVRGLDIAAPGIPMFVRGTGYVIGFQPGITEDRVRAMIRGQGPEAEDRSLELPIVGVVQPGRLSLPAFTLVIGLVDGVNPCAMWVLLVLLGILMQVRSRGRLLLFGGAFVLVSGVVYFLFMTIWSGLFALVGLSRDVTFGLGILVLLMGLVNLKDLIWFKKGASLVIPDKVKPGLYRRMRAVANANRTPIALLGITALAFIVNLVELGCTLGLPAVYTRILSLRPDVGPAARYGYLALYNLAYIVPLAAIVLTYAATLHRLTLKKRGARVLKGISGVLLVTFGLLLMIAPDVLH